MGGWAGLPAWNRTWDWLVFKCTRRYVAFVRVRAWVWKSESVQESISGHWLFWMCFLHKFLRFLTFFLFQNMKEYHRTTACWETPFNEWRSGFFHGAFRRLEYQKLYTFAFGFALTSLLIGLKIRPTCHPIRSKANACRFSRALRPLMY